MAKVPIIEVYSKYYSPDSVAENTPKMGFLEFAVFMTIDPTATKALKIPYGRSLLVAVFRQSVDTQQLADFCDYYFFKGRYLQWLLQHRAEIDLNKEEDVTELLHDALFWFDYNKAFLEQKDINKMDISQLLALYGENRFLDLKARHEITKAEQKGAEMVYIDDDFAIVIPKTFKASCFYGQFTKWCTTERDDPSYFYNYSEKAPLYICIDRHSSHKYQFYFYPGEYDFRNEIDHSVYPWDVPMPEPAKQYFRNVCGAKGYTTEELNAQLAGGLSPEEVFDRVGPLCSGFRLVKNDMRYNYYNPETNQLVGKQWYFFAEDFKQGLAKVWIMRYTTNYLKTDLSLKNSKWIDNDDAWEHKEYYL